MNLESIVSQIAQTIQTRANVDAIFGDARKLDEHVIIPVARIEIKVNGGGGGLGAGNGGRLRRGELGRGAEGEGHAEHAEMSGQPEEMGGQAGMGGQGGHAETSSHAEMSRSGEKGTQAEKSAKAGKGGKSEQASHVRRGEHGQFESARGEMGGRGETSERPGLLSSLGSSLSNLAGKGTGVGGEFEIEVVPLGFIRDGKNGAEFVSIEQTPEGLVGKLEHLIKNLRTGNGRTSSEARM